MLDELRKKPKAVRDRYAFFGALILTVSISSIWFISLSVDVPEKDDVVKPIKDNEALSVWKNFTDKLGSSFAKLGELTATSSTELEEEGPATSSVSDSAIDSVIKDSFRDLEEKHNQQKTIQIATSSKATTTEE